MGVIIARGGHGGASIENVSVYKDLTSQIDGVTDTFDVGELFNNLDVFYRGVNYTRHITLITGNQFTLDFVPTNRAASELTVRFNKLS